MGRGSRVEVRGTGVSDRRESANNEPGRRHVFARVEARGKGHGGKRSRMTSQGVVTYLREWAQDVNNGRDTWVMGVRHFRFKIHSRFRPAFVFQDELRSEVNDSVYLTPVLITSFV